MTDGFRYPESRSRVRPSVDLESAQMDASLYGSAPFRPRIEGQLLELIRTEAKANKRSLNAECVRRLEESVGLATPDADIDQLRVLAVKELLRRLKEGSIDLPHSILAKLALDLDKRRKKVVEEEEEVEPFDVLDVLDSLPEDRAEELRQEKIAELREELARYENAVSD
jgi:hypothetical protein